jgi:hypothetical protein
MADVGKYVTALAGLAEKQNGKAFAHEIALPFVGGAKRVNRLHMQLVESVKKVDVAAACHSKFRDGNVATVVSHRLAALVAVCANDYSAG